MNIIHQQLMDETKKTVPLETKEKLVVIGNGMVSCRFCEELIKNNLHENYEIIVYGEEDKPAYDRVRLTSYAREKELNKLIIKNSAWYKENSIKLNLGEKITSIDLEKKTLITEKSNEASFSKLVFATGSSAFIPPIPGKELEGVFVYRTYRDVDKISEYASGSRVAVVVGGGLLGLEAAEFLKDLGLKTHIIEQADYLMPRQLDIDGSQILMDEIRRKGFELHTGIRIDEIKKNEDRSLDVKIHGGDSISADILVFAAGVRSNSDLAQEAGITCSSSKGIIVNDTLQTSHKDVFAIGECIKHKGQTYGLVAPGYEMARILAERLAGKDSLFIEADMSTRLKMIGVDVVSLGDSLQPFKSIVYKDSTSYRKIIHYENTVVGAIGVGEWIQSGQIQTAIQNRMPLNEKEINYFLKTGSLWENERLDVRRWPDETLICNCMRVSKGTIIDEINKGNSTCAMIKECTGASTVCGSCEPLVQELCGQKVEHRNKPEKTLLTFSFLTLAAVISLLVLPPIWGGTSIADTSHKLTVFLQDSLMRQITGFTMLGLTLFAAMLSLRKRLKKFSFGSFKVWRLIHGIIGFLSLIILMAHTGFSAGRNLNFVLFTVFSIINFFGFITGFASAFEFFGMNKLSAFCRKWKPQITFIHILAFWPLPVLLVFHIIQAYYF